MTDMTLGPGTLRVTQGRTDDRCEGKHYGCSCAVISQAWLNAHAAAWEADRRQQAAGSGLDCDGRRRDYRRLRQGPGEASLRVRAYILRYQTSPDEESAKAIYAHAAAWEADRRRMAALENVENEARRLCERTQLEPPFENEETAELVLALQRVAALAAKETP